VIVEVPEAPCETVTLVADRVNVPLADVPLDPTFTVITPLDAANAESPEYLAVITCAPEVVEEKVYVALPLESAREDVSVVPSTAIVRVPVGVVVTELDSEATVIVMTSLAPEEGVLLAADSEVVVASRDEAELDGQALNRLYRSTDPSPLASS